MTTTQVYITDKTGNKFFNTICSEQYHMSEVRNLTKKLDQAKARPDLYKFLDLESATVMKDGSPLSSHFADMTDSQLLAELGV